MSHATVQRHSSAPARVPFQGPSMTYVVPASYRIASTRVSILRILSNYAVILRHTFRSLTSMFKVRLSMMSLSPQLRHGVRMWSWSVNNGCEFFSSCDLRWGYWQTKSDERDRDKTAFVTRKGQWRFKVLSFGLANAPSQFARIMELVMSGLTYDVCLVYLDDILVFSKTFDEHLDRLATVFDRLDRYSLKLKPSKCSLFQRKVSFLYPPSERSELARYIVMLFSVRLSVRL